MLLLALSIVGCIFLVVIIKNKYTNRTPGITMWELISKKYPIDPPIFHLQLQEWSKQFGGIFKYGIIYFIQNKELAHEMYIKQGEKFAGRFQTDSYAVHKVLFDSNDVVNRSFDSTLVMLRKLGFKALHMYGQGMEQFEAIVREEIRDLLDYLDNFEKVAVDPSEAFSASVINIISTVLFGDKFNYGSEDVKIIAEMNTLITRMDMREVPELTCNPLTPLLLRLPIGRYRPVNRRLQRALLLRDTSFSRLVEKYKARYEPGRTTSVLDSLLADQETFGKDRFTDKMLKGILLDLILGGGATTTLTLRGLIRTMATETEVQQRVREELVSVTGGSRLPLTADKELCPYTHAVILEQLRIQTLLPFGVPHKCMESTDIGGVTVPKDSIVAVNQWVIHHDPALWKHPDDFYPEHFLDDNGVRQLDVYKEKGYAPFGAGRRACIGESLAKSRIFLMFASLIQRFKVLPPLDETMERVHASMFRSEGLVTTPPYKVRLVPI